MSMDLFYRISASCSRIVTKTYSTSFSSAIQLLHKDIREGIFNIYGFVRLADEIVDTFHDYNKIRLLQQFKKETFDSIQDGISLNPILHSFQQTVNKYQIDILLIEDFFESMESDLTQTSHTNSSYEKYIYGSAEVVGLICLYVFCEGNKSHFEELKEPARSLGAAFQKVNFLRDMNNDFQALSRVYFPQCDFYNFTNSEKQSIELDIEQDFKKAYKGIFQLPTKARFGVYVAYKYYFSLFGKIRKTDSRFLLKKRVRIPDYYKIYILFTAGIKNRLRLI
jgi:Phytoene/squalene synthetase